MSTCVCALASEALTAVSPRIACAAALSRVFPSLYFAVTLTFPATSPATSIYALCAPVSFAVSTFAAIFAPLIATSGFFTSALATALPAAVTSSALVFTAPLPLMPALALRPTPASATFVSAEPMLALTPFSGVLSAASAFASWRTLTSMAPA